MPEINANLRWHAIWTRSRHEKVVQQEIARRGIEAFLPLVERSRRWQDRWKTVGFPLFPGYCFAQFCNQDRLQVVNAIGVVRILGMVPAHEIEAVRRLVTSTLPLDPHPYLKQGMEVEVVRGPLAGLRGILLRKAGRARLVVAIDIIRQAASVELDGADVRPVG